MTCTAWRLRMPGFLLLLDACSEGPAANVGDRFFPSTLASTVPTVADLQSSALCGRTARHYARNRHSHHQPTCYQRFGDVFHRNVPHLGYRSDSNRLGGGQHEKI
jgi:hypothetical protein